MKNRILCLLLVFALMLGICGMLASCGGDNGGEEEIPVNPEDLPEADRKALSEGICVSSWGEILALIQDFS